MPSPTSLTCELFLDRNRAAVGWFGRVRADVYGSARRRIRGSHRRGSAPRPAGSSSRAGSRGRSPLGSALLPFSSEKPVHRPFRLQPVRHLERDHRRERQHPPACARGRRGSGRRARVLRGRVFSSAKRRSTGVTPEDPLRRVNAFVSKHVDDLAASPVPVWRQTATGIDADSGQPLRGRRLRRDEARRRGLQSGQSSSRPRSRASAREPETLAQRRPRLGWRDQACETPGKERRRARGSRCRDSRPRGEHGDRRVSRRRSSTTRQMAMARARAP